MTLKVAVEFEVLKSGFLVVFHRNPVLAARKGEGVSEGINEGLNEGLKSLLTAIKDNSGIKAKDLNVVLERRGSRKTGGYYLVDKPAR